MKLFFRLFGIWLLLGCAAAWAQATGPKIDRVDIKFVGPASVSEQFIRGNIRLKAGDTYLRIPRRTTSTRFTARDNSTTSASRWTRLTTAA
jgi:hypothetical protein